MQEKTFVIDLVDARRLVAILRLDDLACAADLSAALFHGGIAIQEYTLTNKDALQAIGRVRKDVEGFQTHAAAIGVGSVRTMEQATDAIAAGVDFIVTPILIPDVIRLCVDSGIPIMPGCYTPTEIATAWELGANMIKVFPARQLGHAFIKDVLAPMPELKLMPTGGVNLNNVASYFEAGASAVGIGGNLLDPVALANQDWNAIADGARQYSDATKR